MFERAPTAEHFNSADHDFLSHASFCCLEHSKQWSDSSRKLRESYWIRRLNSCVHLASTRVDAIQIFRELLFIICHVVTQRLAQINL